MRSIRYREVEKVLYGSSGRTRTYMQAGDTQWMLLVVGRHIWRMLLKAASAKVLSRVLWTTAPFCFSKPSTFWNACKTLGSAWFLQCVVVDLRELFGTTCRSICIGV